MEMSKRWSGYKEIIAQFSGSNIGTVIQLFLLNTAVEEIDDEYGNDLKQMVCNYSETNHFRLL